MNGQRITLAEHKVGGGVTAGRHDLLMAITNHPRAYDGGSQRRYLCVAHGRKGHVEIR